MCIKKRYSTYSLEAYLYARIALEPASKDKPLQYIEVVQIRVMMNILSFFSAFLVPYFICLKLFRVKASNFAANVFVAGQFVHSVDTTTVLLLASH